MTVFRESSPVVLAVCVLSALTLASYGAIDIETVPVGNPGNAGELSGAGAGGYGADRVCGAVAYHYNIGKYEVANAQYATFLNAVDAGGTNPNGVYSVSMGSDPRGKVSFDAEGKSIPGFAAEDAEPYDDVDELRLSPRWSNNEDLSTLKGQVARLRFRLRNARLYAFQIQ